MSRLNCRLFFALLGAAVLLPSPAQAQVAGGNNVVINEMAPTASGDHEIELYNYGPSNQVMTGWTLTYDSDTGVSAPHTVTTYTFPTFTLSRHAHVEVHWSFGTDSATDLYRNSATTIYTEGQIILKNNLGNGIDYVKFGSPFYNAQPADLSWWSNAGYATSACQLYRNKDLNTRVGTDWSNPATCVAGSATAPTYGTLNPNQTGSRRHGKVMINEFYTGSTVTTPWIEIYNPNPFTVYMTGGKLEAFDTANGATPCFTYTLTSPNTYFLAPGAAVAIDIPAATCNWWTGGVGASAGQLRLIDAVGDGWDYMAFNAPVSHYIPPGVAWTGGDLPLKGGISVMTAVRKGDLDTDNFQEWKIVTGNTPDSKGTRNTTQAGAFAYDELGSEASFFNNIDALGAGWGTQVDVDASFLLREYKVRLNTSATQDVHLVVRKLVGATWTRLYDLPLTAQTAANGVYSTGPLATPLQIDSPASYLFMVYSSGPFTFYRSTTGTGRFNYGTVAGYRKDSSYPPGASPSIGGLGLGIEVSQYFLTSAGPDITTLSLPNGEVAVPYSQTLARSGGTAPFVWSLASGALPPGLTLSAGGLLSGTPTMSGAYTFSVTVTDANGAGVSDTQSYTVTIYNALTITALTLPDAEVNFAYNRFLSATGGSGGNVWSKVSGPTWLTVGASGLTNGTPTVTGTATLTAGVTDSLGGSDSHTYNTFTIQPGVLITTTSLPTGVVGTAYTQTLARTGGVPSFTWTIIAGQQPNGLALSTLGVLSGTPLAAGSFSFTVRISDYYGATDTSVITMSVTQPLLLLNNSLPQGVPGVTYPATPMLAAGGVAPYTFSLIGGILPAGIAFFGGSLSGKPSAIGSSPLTFQVTDSTTPVPLTATRLLTLTVADAPDQPKWEGRGLFGGTVSKIEVSANYLADNTLFIVGDQFEIFQSNDRGVTWGRTVIDTANANNSIRSLALSPVFNNNSGTTDAGTAFVSSYESGAWKSVNHGNSFLPVGSGLPCDGTVPCGSFNRVNATALAVSPGYVADNTAWIAAYGAGPLRIFRTVNNGTTWASIADLSALTTSQSVTKIIPSPAFAADQTMFMIISDKFYRSVNGGTSWIEMPYVLPPFGTIILSYTNFRVSPNFAADHAVLLEDNVGRLYRTYDLGTTITPVGPAGSYSLAVASQPGQPPVWAIRNATVNGHYITKFSTNYGDSFAPAYSEGQRNTNVPYFYGFNISPVLAGGGHDLFNGSDKGLDISFDNGFTYAPRDKGLTAMELFGLAGAGNDVIATSRLGFFRSADGGLTWILQKYPASFGGGYAFFQAISPAFASDDTMFLSYFSTLVRSTDSGRSFTTVHAASVYAAAFAPGFASDGTGTSMTLYIGADDGLFKSTDGGATFTLVTLPAACGTPGYRWIGGIAISPDAQVIFVGSSTLCKSVNGGASWTAMTGIANSAQIALSPTYLESGANGTLRKLLFASNSYGVRRSSDGGTTWALVTGVPATQISPWTVISPNAALDNTVLVAAAGGSGGIYRSNNLGLNFNLLTAPDLLYTRDVTGIHLLSGFNGNNTVNSSALASSDGAGIWRSTDGARAFNTVAEYKFISNTVNAVAQAPGGLKFSELGERLRPASPNSVQSVAAGDILASTGNAGIFQSDDDGLTFTTLSRGLPRTIATTTPTQTVVVPSLAVASPLTGLSGNAGLYRYNGASWAKVSGGPVSATGNYTSFLEDGTYLYSTNANGISIRSSDGGASWQAQDAGQTQLVHMDYSAATGPTLPGGPTASWIGPRIEDQFNAVSASLWSVNQSSGPLYSLNSGSNWIGAPGTGDYFLPGGQTWKVIMALGINPASGGRDLVAASTTGLYKSADGGATWRNMSGTGSGLEASSKNFSSIIKSPTAFSTTDVLVGATGSTTGGVYLSGDGGEHWTQINQGFDPNSLNINTLVQTSCSGCPVNYYTGTYGSGVYTRTIAVTAPPAISSWCFTGTGCACGTAAAGGPQSGGQSFRLCGANFLAQPIVEFDGLPATGCVMVSSSVITCTGAGTPLHWPGAATVRVRNNDTRAGLMPVSYTYAASGSRANTLRVAKSGNDAALSYTCSGCSSPLPQVYRSQNSAFSLNVETYIGGAASYTNTGALATGSNNTYFWSVE